MSIQVSSCLWPVVGLRVGLSVPGSPTVRCVLIRRAPGSRAARFAACWVCCVSGSPAARNVDALVDGVNSSPRARVADCLATFAPLLSLLQGYLPKWGQISVLVESYTPKWGHLYGEHAGIDPHSIAVFRGCISANALMKCPHFGV